MLKFNAVSIVGKINDAANNLILAELEHYGVNDIVPSHGDILICLYKKNGLSIKELSEKIHRTQPTVTVLVDKLVKMGFVERIKCKEDRRVSLIFLTEKGVQLKPIFYKISEKLNNVTYGKLTNAEKEQLEQLLEKVLKGF